ncbi:MAG: hypothetical protein Q7S98_01445 [Deltaproteobacteria bacterium]|nr:hypothetical protein [Deltaproteobacteria bacterium]
MGNGTVSLGTTALEASGTAHVGAGDPHTAGYVEGPLNRVALSYDNPDGMGPTSITKVGLRFGAWGKDSSGFSLDLSTQQLSALVGPLFQNVKTNQGTWGQFDFSADPYVTGGWVKYANGASQGTPESTRTVSVTDTNYPTPEQEASGDQALDPSNNGIPAGEVTANPEATTTTRTYEETTPGSSQAVNLHTLQVGVGEMGKIAWHPKGGPFEMFAQASLGAGLSVPLSPELAAGVYGDARVLFGITMSLDPDSYKSSSASGAGAAAPASPAAPAAPAAPATGGAPSTGGTGP